MKEFLPDFIFMTNVCEGRGYEVKFVKTDKGFRGDIYFYKVLQRKGRKIFKSCLDGQKKIYTEIYKALREK